MAANVTADAWFSARFSIAGQEAASAATRPRRLSIWEDAAMRLSKVVWATLGAAALLACRPAVGSGPGCGCGSGCGASCGADTGCGCGGGCGMDGNLKQKLCKWGVTCHNDPAVPWYAPYPPYPVYFGPPYPATSYLPVSYAGSPAETAAAVHNQLVMMGVLQAPAKDGRKEVLPPPKGGDKEPPKADKEPPKADKEPPKEDKKLPD
jgi:hypothetical protein